ncbi:MAG TPA: aromatic acid/H+ symport family MFS transporter [Vicinamibacterales bacterium]|nr:aromatic acid/H+ symport family MFS transporter [Vicinamibacterales bacterium]
MSRDQVRAIVLCAIVIVFDGFDTQCMGFLVPAISENLRIPLADFGPVLSAALVGLMAAAMASGPIADRWGRRWVLIVSVLVFAVCALLTARAHTVQELVVYRFLTGLGLGGAMPNAVALTAEVTPKRLQAIAVATIFTGMPAGAVVASQTAAAMIPRWGWRSVFVVGGAFPLAVAAVLIAMLPESTEWIESRRRSRDTPRRRIAVKDLFTEGRAAGTLLLWIPFFMNLLILYFVVSWLPSLLRQSGLSILTGVQAVAAFSGGGIVGTLTQGHIMRAIGTRTALIGEFALCVLLIPSLAFTAAPLAVMLGSVFALGVCVQAAQAGLNALAAMFYPTPIRATGLGWALGVGRVGSIVGPSVGGLLLSLRWTPDRIFMAGAAPAICAAAAIAAAGALSRHTDVFEAVG